MNPRRVTLADVAREAGVHATTVSLALRNHSRLPLATRERIQALATRMGYAPDPMLRALVAYRGQVAERRDPPTLAYLTNWSTRLGWKKITAHPDFFAGAEAKARELGYKLEHFWRGEPGLTDARLCQILRTRDIRGIILASHMLAQDSIKDFDWPWFSAVKIDYYPHHPELHNVTNDQCSVVRLAVQRVVAAGYRRVGFIMHRGWNHSVDRLWSAGFLCEQAELPPADHVPLLLFPELEPVDRWMNDASPHVSVSPELFGSWFRTYQPDVIITNQPFVREALAALRLRVPQDVALVDVFLANPDGTVAGVSQNHATVGEIALEILAGQLHHHKYGLPEIPTTTFVEGTWFDGASCPIPKQEGRTSTTARPKIARARKHRPPGAAARAGGDGRDA